MIDGPPPLRLGDRLSVTLEGQVETRRKRETEHVSDVLGRWAVRYVRRHWPAYHVEGWSAEIRPGQTYHGWYFGSVEVDLARLEVPE